MHCKYVPDRPSPQAAQAGNPCTARQTFSVRGRGVGAMDIFQLARVLDIDAEYHGRLTFPVRSADTGAWLLSPG